MGRLRSFTTGSCRPEAVPTCPGVSAVFGCVRLEIFSACEIERRPRGASRINPLLRLLQASNLSDRRARPLFVRLDIASCTKAVARTPQT